MDALVRCLLLALLAAMSTASRAQDFSSLGAQNLELCSPSPACEQIAGVRVLGVVKLPTRLHKGMRLGGLSGLAWDDDDGVLYAVSDQGALFGLQPVFQKERLVDVSLSSAVPLLDPLTHKPVKWRRSDSEGLDILHARNGRKGDAELVVSFEGDPRIARYRPDGRFIADVPLSKSLRNVKNYPYNKMLEAVCIHPREGILTAPEELLNPRHDATRLYRTDGRSWRIPAGRGGIVALECLPDGDILMLERELMALSLRWVITLRRLHLPASKPYDSMLSAQTIAVLDSAEHLLIDNFEGLTRHRGNRFFMVSDDNNVFLQQTLLMYFELLPASSP